MTDTRKLIAANIRAIMGQEDITPAMLREWTGLDGRTINDVVWGRRHVSIPTLETIASVLQRPIKDFFEE